MLAAKKQCAESDAEDHIPNLAPKNPNNLCLSSPPPPTTMHRGFLALLGIGVRLLAPKRIAAADDGVRTAGLDGGVVGTAVSPASRRIVILVDVGGAKGAVEEG